MYSISINSLKYGFAVAALAGLAGTAMAKTIVVRATGPSSAAYPAGKILPDNGAITLKANDVVVVLDAKGTRTLRGGGTHQIAAPSTQTASAAQSSYQRLLASTGARPSRGGVSRGGLGDGKDGLPARSPNLWFVDVRQAGTVCVADPGNLKLWRPAIEGDATATIAPAPGGKAGTVTFYSGSMVKAWPVQHMPIADGATYNVRMGNGAAVPIRFALIPASAAGAPIEDMAATLAERGCNRQLELLADAVSADQPAPPAS